MSGAKIVQGLKEAAEHAKRDKWIAGLELLKPPANAPIWAPKAAEHYDARYVGYYDLPDREGPFYVFYTKNPDREQGHDNYFGLFQRPKAGARPDDAWITLITSAASIRNARFCAIKLENGWLVSRYRHDYCTAEDAMLDGGLAYTRCNTARPPGDAHNGNRRRRRGLYAAQI